MNTYIKPTKSTKSTTKSTKPTKSTKNNNSKIKKGGTPYTFPSYILFMRNYGRNNYERLKPMDNQNKMKIMAEEYAKEKDRIRKDYVYKNFPNERDKEQLIKNLKKAEEFTPAKKESIGLLGLL
tara:strand:+ start:454 stop:825 length:372 start_codon:yes stop_codon:yes gene_type:complete